jgi:hypothetical protein
VSQRWFVDAETAGLTPLTGYSHIAFDVHNKFYFWDETGTSAFGPFETLVECIMSMDRYASSL